MDDCTLAQEKVNSVKDFESLFLPHQAKWKALWNKFDIEIEGDPFTQQVLRLHTFHLLPTEDTSFGMSYTLFHSILYMHRKLHVLF